MKIGKVSESVLKRSVLRQLKTKRDEVVCGAGVGDDCAIFSFSDALSDSLSVKEKIVSCVQEAVIMLPENDGRKSSGKDAAGQPDVNFQGNEKLQCDIRDIRLSMQQLIEKCANNLAASGAEPVAVMLALLLPESIEEPNIKSLMQEAEAACHALSLQIAGGQTRVSAAVTAPVAVVTGYGRASGENYCTAKAARPGQDIVISKWIGLEGTAVLAKRHREKLLHRYPAYLVEEAAGFDKYLSILPEAATAVKSGVCAMHDASEGGIFGALWELAEGAGVGLTIDLKKLPLRQETVEVCECCNVNPYELQSGGCLVMTSEDGPGLAAALNAEGIPAVVVGRLTDSNDRIILNEDEVRYMDRPRTDEIYQ